MEEKKQTWIFIVVANEEKGDCGVIVALYFPGWKAIVLESATEKSESLVAWNQRNV